MEKYYNYELVNNKNLILEESLKLPGADIEALKNNFILDLLPLIKEIIWVWSERYGWESREKEFYTSEAITKACEIVKSRERWISTPRILFSVERYLRGLMKVKRVQTVEITEDYEEAQESHLDLGDLKLIKSYIRSTSYSKGTDIFISKIALEISIKDLATKLGITRGSVIYNLNLVRGSLIGERTKKTEKFLKLQKALLNQ